MALEARLLTGLALAVAAVYWATPFAIRVAHKLEFYDRPAGYKGHAAPTPYLGGAAVVAGFVAATLALTGDWERTLPVTLGVAVLWLVGTVDDRRNVTPLARVAVELGLATVLWWLDLGWQLGFGAGVDLAVTAFWIVAVVNAFNLFDNMDGAAASMASVAAAGIMALGISQGDVWVSVAAAALCGACLGFLPHNLATPARIFLGDGGSMPVGFAVAAIAMIGVSSARPEWQALAMGLLFVGVPALDTALVVVSRRRRGISILTGGRDHLTHRTRERLRTARAVALALGSAQAVISALALTAVRGGPTAIVVAVLVYLVGVGVAITVLDRRPSPAARAAETAGLLEPPGPPPHGARPSALPRSLPLALPFAIVLGVSPFFSGFYDSRLWVPGGLVLVVVITAAVVAAPLRLTRRAAVAVGGLAGLAVWALTSSLWADSIEQAVVDGNRLMVAAAVLAVGLLVARTERSALWLIGALCAGTLTVAGYSLVTMLGSDAGSLFLGGRLDGPLGYINGQGSFYLIGLWPLLAIAEYRRHPALSGLAMAASSVLLSLVVLSQSRGVVMAGLASLVVVVLLVPGRLRRLCLFAALAASVAAALPSLLAVYDEGRLSGVPDAVASRAATAALLSATAVGLIWAVLNWGAARRPAVARRVRPVAAGLLAVAAATMLVLAAVSVDDISRTAREQYSSFVELKIGPQGSGVDGSPGSGSRLASGAGTRYDYWRIAWGSFRDEPVHGVGAGNYDAEYFARRATTEDVRQPHSLELQTLSELGLVGAALLALVLGAFLVGAVRLARAGRQSSSARLLAVSATGAMVAWLVQTTVDWIHLLPGVTGVALALGSLLLGHRTASREDSMMAEPARVSLRRRVVPALLVAVCLAVAGVSLSRQGLAEHFRAAAERALAKDPGVALRDADRALRLDPEAVQSYYVKAAALARFNEAGAARQALLSAAEREPRDFLTWALLGDLAVRTGQTAQARRYYQRALELNPRDPALIEAARNPTAAAPAR